MQGKTAAVIGASGLIGGELVNNLLSDDRFQQVYLLGRRPSGFTHSKISEFVVDFSDSDALKRALSGVEIIFCAIGTTLKKVKGDQQLYRQIDFDIPLKAASAGKEMGAKQFLLVTAFGANSKSRNFYLRLKGEVEEAIHALHLPVFSVFHPSVLLGKRKENRPAERLAVLLLPYVEWMFPFNYRTIKASTVAKSMVAAAAKNTEGKAVYNRKEMFALTCAGH